MTIEGLRLRFRNKVYLPLTRNYRRRFLKNEDFTIISNNCWGGTVYESYGIQKQSPTVGMFIMPKDYLNLLQNLKYYMALDLVFIDSAESKWRDYLCSYKGWGTWPIARLGDIELQLLHAHGSEEQIRNQWKRRVQRIHWNKMIYKFNDQNGCSDEDLDSFLKLPLSNKLFFCAKKTTLHLENLHRKGVFVINQPANYKSVLASYEPYGRNKYFNLNKIINEL